MPALPWGLTQWGFLPKTYEQILAELEDAAKSALGATLNTKAGPVQQLLALWASRERTLWELAAAVYAANDPDLASGAALDAVAALTGVTRRPATKSTVAATVTLGAGMTLPAGSIASVDGDPSARFVTTADVTSEASGDYQVAMEAETAGAVGANAGTLTVIETPVSGWSAVTNELDAVVGYGEETDAELRARREEELAAQGTGPVDALRADLLALDGVVDVQVYENTTDATDGDGLPPHSFECVVYDGSEDGTVVDADDIAQVIWDAKPAGIQAHGQDVGTAPDSTGTAQSISFSRPTTKDVYLTFEVNVAASRGWSASTSPALVKQAAVTLGEGTFGPGADVILARFYQAVFGIPGVVDVTAIKAGFSASPSGTANLTIGRRELAVFDTSRVVVTPSTVVPS